MPMPRSAACSAAISADANSPPTFMIPMTGERYNPDFAAMARSCGVEGVRVDRAGDLGEAIRKGIAANKPYLIDVDIAADINPSGAGVWELPGLGQSKPGIGVKLRADLIASFGQQQRVLDQEGSHHACGQEGRGCRRFFRNRSFDRRTRQARGRRNRHRLAQRRAAECGRRQIGRDGDCGRCHQRRKRRQPVSKMRSGRSCRGHCGATAHRSVQDRGDGRRARHDGGQVLGRLARRTIGGNPRRRIAHAGLRAI